MHDYIPPPALPPPSSSTPPALPERPRYPVSTLEVCIGEWKRRRAAKNIVITFVLLQNFQDALQKGGDTQPKALLDAYIGNCKTFRTWYSPFLPSQSFNSPSSNKQTTGGKQITRNV
jgi:hypothetical protein